MKLATLFSFPKFVMVERDVDDVAIRIFMKMFSKGHPYAYNLYSTKDYVNWYYSVMDTLREKLPGRTSLIKYEEIAGDPERVRDELAEFADSHGANGQFQSLVI